MKLRLYEVNNNVIFTLFNKVFEEGDKSYITPSSFREGSSTTHWHKVFDPDKNYLGKIKRSLFLDITNYHKNNWVKEVK